MADPINIPAPQSVYLGLSAIDALDKSSSPYNPFNIVVRPTDVNHGSATDHIFGINTALGDNVSAKSYYNYKTYFENWRGNQELAHQNNARSQPPLESTHVNAKRQTPKH